jgi:putative DNA primase/helicase
MIEQERIPRQNRQSEIKIFSRFEELQPRLLGYIFDILSRALTIKDSIKLAELPRMADFGMWGEAVARDVNTEIATDKEQDARARIDASIKVVDANIMAYNILENGPKLQPDKL